MSESAVRFLEPPIPDERIVAVEMEGRFTVDDMKTVIERLQAIVDRGEKALMYMDMKGYEGFEWGVASEKLKHMGMLWRALDRYAIVGDARWLETWIKIIDPITPQQMKHFHPEERDEAWAWLTASEASESAEAAGA